MLVSCDLLTFDLKYLTTVDLTFPCTLQQAVSCKRDIWSSLYANACLEPPMARFHWCKSYVTSWYLTFNLSVTFVDLTFPCTLQQAVSCKRDIWSSLYANACLEPPMARFHWCKSYVTSWYLTFNLSVTFVELTFPCILQQAVSCKRDIWSSPCANVCLALSMLGIHWCPFHSLHILYL